MTTSKYSACFLFFDIPLLIRKSVIIVSIIQLSGLFDHVFKVELFCNFIV
jgi:hypothetical protein